MSRIITVSFIFSLILTTFVSSAWAVEPVVTGIYPDPSKLLNTREPVLQVVFDQDLDPATLPDAGCYLRKNGGVLIETDIYLFNNNTVVIDPVPILEPGTDYNLYCGWGIRNLAGEEWADFFMVKYKLPFGVSATWPIQDAVIDDTTPTIAVEFMEPVDPTTIEAANWEIMEGGVPVVTVSVSLHGDGRTVLVTPDSPLTPGTSYLLYGYGGIQNLLYETWSGWANVRFTIRSGAPTCDPSDPGSPNYPGECAANGWDCGVGLDGCNEGEQCGFCAAGGICNKIPGQTGGTCLYCEIESPDICATTDFDCGVILARNSCGLYTRVLCGQCLGDGNTCDLVPDKTWGDCSVPCDPVDTDPCGTAGYDCGFAQDDCGTAHSCGTCEAGQICDRAPGEKGGVCSANVGDIIYSCLITAYSTSICIDLPDCDGWTEQDAQAFCEYQGTVQTFWSGDGSDSCMNLGISPGPFSQRCDACESQEAWPCTSSGFYFYANSTSLDYACDMANGALDGEPWPPYCCVPDDPAVTCANYGYDCGTAQNNCLEWVNCGDCETPYECYSHECLCVDRQTDEEVCGIAECGTVNDLCDEPRDCGTCTSPETCQSNMCGVFMTDCTGGKSDPNSGLCWQDPPSAAGMTWYVAAGVYDAAYNPASDDYCSTLGSGWRLPTITELRSLFRSGTDPECYSVEWDMAWTSVPAGYCEVWDGCLSALDCWYFRDECTPSGCGPGCFWDAALGGTCGQYWSASEAADFNHLKWLVNFSYGEIWNLDMYYSLGVRCVRSMPECDPGGTCCNPDGTDCEHGCDGTDCYPECNPSDNCCTATGTWRTDCAHGCDVVTGNCYPDCDPATDSCCETDGQNCILGCKLNGDCYLPMTDCTGGKYDPNSGLCWQDPASATSMNWFVAAGVEHVTYNPAPAENYCDDLGGGWRLPTISELRSLFRSGTNTGCEVIEWDVSWSSVPTGYCEAWESCLSVIDCYQGRECDPNTCGPLEGPGAGGCYWDAALSGTCGWYWSASEDADPTVFVWLVVFDDGDVHFTSGHFEVYVRCVRSGP